MKLRKLFSAAAMALLVGVAATAQTSMEDVRIYINPGHGSWGPNNRHCATIGHSPISTENPDTTDFFESNTNLRKCLSLLDKLVEYGVPFDRTKNQTNDNPNRIGAALDMSQNIVMSHVKCGPYPYDANDKTTDSGNDFNRTLSVIAAEVEANNFDMFISIHSNAATDGNTVNYLYFAYDDDFTGNDKDASIEMSRCGWNHRILDRHTQWSHYDYTMTAADVAAGKGKIGYQGLGVLNHSVSGYLVEGYFHTYQPARHRYMNFDVCRIEGIDYARGVADYFGWSKETSNGCIYGIVRDKDTKFTDELYTPNAATLDVYKPLNGVVVTLKKEDGTTYATYTTDVNYNGAFVFLNVPTGNYTLEFSHADYKASEGGAAYVVSEVDDTEFDTSIATSLSVTVEAAKTAYPTAFLQNVNYEPPTIVYENYPDSTAGKSNFVLEPKYYMTPSSSNALATNLSGKTIRRQIVRNDLLYVLAVDSDKKPYVYVYDIANKTVLKTLGTTAATSGTYPISDIALTADGYLVGINKANQAFGGTNNMIAYKWENDENGVPDGEVAVWWSNNFAGNYSNGIDGESMVYDGTLADGKFIYTATTTATSGNTMLVIATISEGQYTGYYRNNNDNTYLKTTNLGETYKMTLSPRADDQIIFNSASVQPFEIKLNTTDAGVPTILASTSSDVLNVKSANESYFKYAGKSLMVAPNINSDGNVAGVTVLDITDGLDQATEVTTDAAITASSYTFASAHGELALTIDEAASKTTAAELELFLAFDGNVTKWTKTPTISKTLTQGDTSGSANPFAYALSSEATNDALSVKFSLNTAATAVKIVVKDENGEEVASATGATTEGEQTATIDISNLENGTYTWEVAVEGEARTTVSQFAAWKFFHPCGLDVDNSNESASFGTLFVTDGYTNGKTSGYISAQADGTDGSGLYMFTAAGEQIANTVKGGYRFFGKGLTHSHTLTDGTTTKTDGGDFSKVAVADDGRIFVTRYNMEGDYILSAPSLEELVANGEFTTSLVAGMTMTDTKVYNDASGNFLVGPVLGFDVKGSGEDTKLIAITRASNSMETATSLNRAVEYSLGTADVLPTPTTTAFDKKYTISYNKAANVAYDNRGGIWYCQYRGTPDNANPALVYADENGELQYFEGAGGKTRRNAAVAINPEGTMLAAASAAGVFSIYEINRDADGSVFLFEKYKVTHKIGNDLRALSWDAAGNLYASASSSEYVIGVSVPRAEEAYTTNAASKYAFEINRVPTGVDEIGAEDAPVEYYNLQGIKVENPSKGIYIKKQGRKTTKVVL